MKRVYLIICVIIITLATGCTKDNSNMSVSIREPNVTKIQIVKAMGNPQYGAESKIFTNEDEVSSLIDAMNNITIEEKVKSGDMGVGDDIDFYYYLDDGTINEFQFRSHNTIWLAEDLYYISFNGKSIFDIYDSSSTEEIKVDKNLKEMK